MAVAKSEQKLLSFDDRKALRSFHTSLPELIKVFRKVKNICDSEIDDGIKESCYKLLLHVGNRKAREIIGDSLNPQNSVYDRSGRVTIALARLRLLQNDPTV